MKSITLIIAVALCAVLSAYADLAGTYKTIAMDGSSADWSNPGDVLYDATEIGAGAPASSSYDAISLANDGVNLYMGLDTSGAGGASVWNTWTRNIYLDTDSVGGTGFNAGWMAHGYDYLVQYGASGSSYSLFSFGGASQSDWTWNWLGLVTYAYADETSEFLELSVGLSSLGLTGGEDIVAEFNVTGTGVTTETWAYQWESGAETYTVAIPEPATLSMVATLGGAILFFRRKFMR
ncbi:MAG: PEP-CTERM sorting domain-containing protein [Verrucomicrobiota bacterium]